MSEQETREYLTHIEMVSEYEYLSEGDRMINDELDAETEFQIQCLLHAYR